MIPKIILFENLNKEIYCYAFFPIGTWPGSLAMKEGRGKADMCCIFLVVSFKLVS